MSFHGGQSNALGEGDLNDFPSISSSQALVGYQSVDSSVTPNAPLEFDFNTYGSNTSNSANGFSFISIAADNWYADAFQRGLAQPYGLANFAVGGRPTNFFYPPGTAGNTGIFSEGVNACLINTKEALAERYPDKSVVFQFCYWDQVERDTGNGTNANLSYEDFVSRRDIRAATIARLFDSLTGNSTIENRNFAVTNPNLVLFLRDVSDGQWSIGGGGVALSADVTHADYIIKASPESTFNGELVNGIHVPYNSNNEGDNFYEPSAEWNGWMATRSAHQLLTDPSHNSPFYREGIILINADGIGTRGSAAISGDGIHFGATSSRIVAQRFIEQYNLKFGTDLEVGEL